MGSGSALLFNPSLVTSASPAAGTRVGSAAIVAVLVGSVSALTAWLLQQTPDRRRGEWIGALVLLAVLVAGLWGSTVALKSGAIGAVGEPLDQVLSVRPTLGDTWEDYKVYLQLYHDVNEGKPYYDSVLVIFRADPNRGNQPPPGVVGYRLPTIYYLWRAVPRPEDLPLAFLLFAAIAVVSSFVLAEELTRPGMAVLAPILVSPAFLYLATTTYVTFVDAWAMPFTLLGIALLVASILRSSRGLLWAAVAACLLGALFREILIYPMLFALASTLLLPKGGRWREAWPWLVGIAGFAAAYAAHVVAVAGRTSSGRGSLWLRGGWGHFVATVRFFEGPFGAKPWLLPALIAVGILGAVIIWRREGRVGAFLTAVTAIPLAGFLVVGNGGVLDSGQLMGYWAILVVPVALSLVPVAVDWALTAVGVVEGATPSG